MNGGFKQQHQALFRVLAQRMREAIQNGEWSYGQQLPSEQELAQSLHVSRATLREAIGLLVSEGLIVKRHGIGNFVSPRPLSAGLETLQSTTEWIRSSGREPGTRGKVCVLRVATEDECEELGLAGGQSVIEVSRIRTADGQPIVYSRDRVPVALIADVPAALQALEAEESLLGVLDAHGVYITEARTTVKAVDGDSLAKAKLKTAPHEVILQLKQLHVNAAMEPCLYSDIFFCSSKMEFRVIRKR